MKILFSFFSVLFCLNASIYADEVQEHSKKVQEIVAQYGHQRSEVLKMSETFLDELRAIYNRGEGLIESDLHRIYDAICFAAEKHQFQERKGKGCIPYIIHPIGVAYNLIHIGHVRDPDIIIGALLHDTVEDTGTSFDEIKDSFGSRVEGFVREVTDDKSLPKEERKRLQIVNAPHKSAGATQIKLADKLYNLNDMLKNPPVDWTQERIDQYFVWAKNVVDALPCVNSSLKEAVDNLYDSKAK